MDSRISELARVIVNYSCEIKKEEKVFIECFGNAPHSLVKEIIKEIYKVKGIPLVALNDNSILREILKECNTEQMKFMAKTDLVKMKESNSHIIIKAPENVYELNDIGSKKMNLYTKYYLAAITEERFKKEKWVIVRYLNNSLAQLANKSLESFEDYFFKVCNIDYIGMSNAMDKLIELMEKTKYRNV